MASPRIALSVTDPALLAAFARIRDELHISTEHSAEAVAEAAAAARSPQPYAERRDRRDLELVTIDPPGSRDLDQAFGATAGPGETVSVSYAIADVACFVATDRALDRESRQRGATMFAPDRRAPLYPTALSEGGASLLPAADRPALLWTFEVAADGAVESARVERALVRSRQALSYAEAQAEIDGGSARKLLVLLREVGLRRMHQEAERGAVSLELPDQEVTQRDGEFVLAYADTLPVERWNAQISLMTGMAAAAIMLDNNIGLLRTMPPPATADITALRRAAHALHIEWPAAMSYPERIRTLDPHRPESHVLMVQAARTLRGAGYLAFDGAAPEHAIHSAIGAPYAHVTAPLRRCADRFANEIVLALAAGSEPPEWARGALDQLATVATRAAQRQNALDRAVNDLVEAATLQTRAGAIFRAEITEVERDQLRIQIDEPAVVATVAVRQSRAFKPGQTIAVRLVEVSVPQRRVTFGLA